MVPNGRRCESKSVKECFGIRYGGGRLEGVGVGAGMVAEVEEVVN